MKHRANFSLVDTPYNVVGLEVFDFLIAFVVSGILIPFAFFMHPVFLLLWFLSFAGMLVYLKMKKRGRGWGYTKRLTARILRDLTGRKRLYA